MKNLKASNTRSVPNQMYFARRWSSEGPKAAASRVRTLLLTPSAPTIEVGARELIGAGLGVEVQPHAEPVGTALEDVEQHPPAQRREAVPARGDDLAAVVDVDLRPAREVTGDLRVGGGLGRLDRLQRLVGEHDAEAERVVGRVALVDVHVERRLELLDQDREVEPCGTSADDRDPHACSIALL